MIAPPQTLEIRITREFDAPREEVFRAWTVPAEIAAWYGPAQFDTPEDKIHIDLRVGGRYELTMVRRDTGAEMPTGYEILELDPPSLLVLRADAMPDLGMPEPVITASSSTISAAAPACTHRRPLPRRLRTRRNGLELLIDRLTAKLAT